MGITSKNPEKSAFLSNNKIKSKPFRLAFSIRINGERGSLKIFVYRNNGIKFLTAGKITDIITKV